MIKSCMCEALLFYRPFCTHSRMSAILSCSLLTCNFSPWSHSTAHFWLRADGGDSIRAGLVEVKSSGLDNLTVSQLMVVCQIARLHLTLHQVISIHRHLSKAHGSTCTSPESILAIFGIAWDSVKQIVWHLWYVSEEELEEDKKRWHWRNWLVLSRSTTSSRSACHPDDQVDCTVL